MGTTRRLLTLLAIGWLWVCGADAQEPSDPGTLFTGATVFPGFDGRRPEPVERRVCSAVLVRGGRVIGIGGEAELAATDAGRRARRVDLTGLYVYPGFQDAHGELEQLGADLERIDLSGCAGLDDLARALGQRARETPAGRWIVGVGWSSARWAASVGGGEAPDSLGRALDARIPGHPVLIEDRSGDGVLLNRAGLEAIGAADSSRWLTGAAAARATAALPAATPADRERRILRGQEALLARGFTCVHLMGVDRQELAALRRVHAAGRLDVRVVAYTSELPSAEDPRAWGDDRLSVAGVHLDLDGALATRGAALSDAYSDAPGWKGELLADAPAAWSLLVEGARAGAQPSLGATGDRAVGLALDLLERGRTEVPGFIGLRPRLAGADLIGGGDSGRLRPLGVVPSLQPARLLEQLAWAPARLGEERLLGLQPWSSLAAATGQPLALGSGYPAGPADPRAIFHAAVARRAALARTPFLPAMALTAHRTLGALTSGAAAAVTQEDRRGLLARGYGGDLTVLDVDLTQLGWGDAASALEARVVMTVVDGEILHDAR